MLAAKGTGKVPIEHVAGAVGRVFGLRDHEPRRIAQAPGECFLPVVLVRLEREGQADVRAAGDVGGDLEAEHLIAGAARRPRGFLRPETRDRRAPGCYNLGPAGRTGLASSYSKDQRRKFP